MDQGAGLGEVRRIGRCGADPQVVTRFSTPRLGSLTRKCLGTVGVSDVISLCGGTGKLHADVFDAWKTRGSVAGLVLTRLWGPIKFET